ncbi:MAG: amidohydrolase family protein [Chloroflexi bacterium]|nr:amidohydrolase family protein [Chloroflexota bacterium]
MTTIHLPGLVDVHTHLRVPGQAHKEDFASGTAAALAGGFTTVLAMPNTQPPITTPEVLNLARAEAKATARCDVGIFAGAAIDNAVLLPLLAQHSCGLKIYLDQTFGPLRVNDLATLMAHFATWPGGSQPIAVHAEENSLPQVLGLAAVYQQKLHICHVSRRAELELIARAKERGLPVTCEVTPHHLFLNREDAARLGAYGQMRPPLQSEDDRAGLWELLAFVDCIATDHAPHTRAEKESSTPPPGIPGLETALPLMLTAVHAGRLAFSRITEMMSSTPRRIYNLPPAEENTWIEVDADAAWSFPSSGWQTRADWSAFAGREVRGRVERVMLRGQEAYAHQTITAAPGSGHVLF